MRRLLLVPSLAVTALTACVVPSTRASYRIPVDGVNEMVPRDGATAVRIAAGVGDIEVIGDSGATDLHVRVRLRSQDARRLETECLPKSRLSTSRTGGVVSVDLDQQTRNQCGELWTVRIPASMGVQVEGSVTHAVVRGPMRALDIRASGPGSVSGQVVSSAVTVLLEHGSVTLDVAGSHGEVSAVSDIGRVALTVGGFEVQPARDPGPGDRAEARGNGDGAVRVRSKLGNVRLNVRN